MFLFQCMHESNDDELIANCHDIRMLADFCHVGPKVRNFSIFHKIVIKRLDRFRWNLGAHSIFNRVFVWKTTQIYIHNVSHTRKGNLLSKPYEISIYEFRLFNTSRNCAVFIRKGKNETCQMLVDFGDFYFCFSETHPNYSNDHAPFINVYKWRIIQKSV